MTYTEKLSAIRNGFAPKTTGPKEKKPIAKRSEKMKVEMKKYIPAMKAFLAMPENQFCKIRMKGCKGKAACVHHTAGRDGVKLHDTSDWVPSCLVCNLTVETSDKEAREKGFKKSRHKKILTLIS